MRTVQQGFNVEIKGTVQDCMLKDELGNLEGLQFARPADLCLSQGE